MLTLHHYWRSSASYRVRIGLGLKGLAYDRVAVNLAAGEQTGAAYAGKNPMKQVPTLEITEDDGTTRALRQSLPILEYLDERWPEPPLLPRDPYLRARAREIAELVNSGIQPLQNLSTLRAVKALGGDDQAWSAEFIARGLAALDAQLADVAGDYCVGDAPTIADCCVVPQLYNARRFGVALEPFPRLVAIDARCARLPAFAAAHPECQPDAPTH